MAKDKVGREEKKLPATEKAPKADSPPSKKEEKKESKKWYAQPPVKAKCSCRSEFQDRRYGIGVRLHSIFKAGKRCTVCHNEKL